MSYHVKSKFEEDLNLEGDLHVDGVYIGSGVYGSEGSEVEVNFVNCVAVAAGSVNVSGNVIAGSETAYGFIHPTGLWDDLRFPAQGINPPGADNAPTRNQTDGLLEFSASADNIISIVAQMPHSWKSGTNVHPHVHILTSDDPGANLKTRWRLGYKIMDVGDPEPAFTYVNTDANVAAFSGGAPVHQLIELTELDMTGKQDSCCLHLLIQRSAGDGTNDTYAGVVRLLEFDIHYLVSTLGSINEYGDNY